MQSMSELIQSYLRPPKRFHPLYYLLFLHADHEGVTGAAVPVPEGDAIGFSKELRDDPVHDTTQVAMCAALGSDRVRLVEEDDAGVGIVRRLDDRLSLPTLCSTAWGL